MRPSYKFGSAAALALALLAGCASVTTDVTVLDRAQKYAPTEYAAILLEFPERPYAKIALIEARGTIGGSEAELLEDARKKAQALGADAVVRLEVIATVLPPTPYYVPAYPYYGFYSRYSYPYRSFYYPPYGYSPFPSDYYQWIGGGTVQTLKAVAIKYTDTPGRPTIP
jgi:hypothetical protein